MLDFLENRLLLKMPVGDRDGALVVQVFNSIWVGTVACLLVGGIGTIFIFEQRTGSAATVLVVSLVLVISLWAAHRGHVRRAAMMLVCGLWVVFTVNIWLCGTLNTAFIGMHVAVVAIAGALIGLRFALIIAFMSITAALALTLLQGLGFTWPTYYPMRPWAALFVLLFTIILIVSAISGILRAFEVESQHAYREIETRRKAEEILKASEARYRFLTEHGSDLIWTLDMNLRTTFVTPSVNKILGFTPEERMLQEAEDQLTPESLQYARQRLLDELIIEREQGNQEGKSALIDLDYYHKNGAIVCLQTAVTFIRDEKGTPIGLHGISRDITELRGTQEALIRNDAQKQAILDGITANVAFVNENLEIQWVNKAAAESVGKLPSEMIGHTCHAFWANPDKPCDGCPTVKAFKTKRSEHTIMVTPDGRVWEERGEPVFDSDGRLMGVVEIALDITENKKAEEEREALRSHLFQVQKMEAIGTLTGGIAHDFNNLFTIINGYTELILSEKTEDDSSYEDLQKILQTGRKGAELVQRLLALSRKSEINPQPTNLNGIAESLCKLLERTLPKMIQAEVILEKDLHMVNADSGQMEQVLLNLCINAREAMPEGGRLRIETKNVHLDEADCKLQVTARPGPHVVIEVADTGTGMDGETLSRLFDPFFTTKGWDYRKGTGLSLPAAKGIVEQHGGWITCESEPGRGTMFRIYFPAIGDAAAEKSVPAVEAVPASQKILLVDDEEYVRDLGKRILERAGYEVRIACNGKEALEIYSKEQSNIGLVVLDLIMPQMNGEKCIEELYHINPDVKLVVSSGHSLEPNERQRLGAYVKGFVSKPYQMRDFLEVVVDVLKRT